MGGEPTNTLTHTPAFAYARISFRGAAGGLRHNAQQGSFTMHTHYTLASARPALAEQGPLGPDSEEASPALAHTHTHYDTISIWRTPTDD